MSEPKNPCLCLPTTRVRAVLGDFSGFVGLPELNPYETLRDLTAGDACRFLPREPGPVLPHATADEGDDFDFDIPYTCESDERFKQPVPYLVLTQSGRILTYFRAKSGGEDRLHAKRSVGLGGHVEECDQDVIAVNFWLATIRRAALRELQEETKETLPSGDHHGTFCGFINDDSDAVGRVHLGLLYLVALAPGVAPRFAPEIADPQWKDMREIDVSRYEGWSRIVVEAMRDGRIGP